MKYYESTSFFLRVIIVDLVSNEKKIKVKLLPMFHIGEKEYYDSILHEANKCDLLLHEGLNLNISKIDKQIGRYNKSAKALNLISQYEYFQSHKIEPELINADLSGKRAKEEWKKLKLAEKLKYRLIDPIKFRYQTYNITREKLSKAFMTSAEEAYLAYGPIEEVGTLENLRNRARESIVFEKIEQSVIDLNQNKTIGVMYGAGHMKRIGDFITSNFDFKIQEAKFLIVYHL